MEKAQEILSTLYYRLFEKEDVPGILQLWEEDSGWGGITDEQLNNWYFKTPCGPCFIVIAQNQDKMIVGQMVFNPVVVLLEGNEIKACRGSAPILKASYRRYSINHPDHPAFAMIRFGMEAGKQQGYHLVYSFPASGWAALLRAFPKYGLPYGHIALYDCFVLSLKSNCPSTDSNFTTGIAKFFTEEYDQLWEAAKESFPLRAAVKRNAAWLKWKISSHLVIEIRYTENNSLMGYAAIDKQSGLIVDMLARTKEDLTQVIKSVVHGLHASNPDRLMIDANNLKGMLTPQVQVALEIIPFAKERFTFAFFCYALQNSVSMQSIHPTKWYMMPND